MRKKRSQNDGKKIKTNFKRRLIEDEWKSRETTMHIDDICYIVMLNCF